MFCAVQETGSRSLRKTDSVKPVLDLFDTLVKPILRDAMTVPRGMEGFYLTFL